MSDNILSVKNLYKKFGTLEVLKGVNININKGDVVAVIGPSGCGKSTFLRCLNLLEEPTAGEIMLENEYVFKNERVYLKQKLKELKAKKKTGSFDENAFLALKAEYETLAREEKEIEKSVAKTLNLHRQKIGMVFQQFNLFPHLTVLKNITLAPMRLKKISEEEANAQAMALLEKVVAIRSRAVYLPLACWASMRFSPPPSFAVSRFSTSF